MPDSIVVPLNIHVSGHLSANTQSVAAASVDDDSWDPSGTPLAAPNAEHTFRKSYAQPNTAATTETRVLHVTHAAGTIVGFKAGSIAIAVGAATVTLDLKKNGTTVLTGVITLDTGNTAYTAEAGTISVDTLAAGDVLTLVITATAGGGTLPTGVYASVSVDEDYD